MGNFIQNFPMYFRTKTFEETEIKDKKENSEITVVVTGGDSFFLDRELKSGIFVEPFLVLKGLNEILDYNENR